MTPSESHPASRTFASRYQVGARHGAGVEAATFEAIDLRTGATVALRLVHPELSDDEAFAASFHAAMQRAQGIQHPNVAQVLDSGTDTWNGRPVLYVVSEYLSGGSLRDLLDRGRLLSPSQGLMVGLEACKGLDAIHRSGLLHGEIRPATLIFGDDSRLRIVDPGLSQALSQWTWAPDQQPRQELAMYAAPERSLGEEQVPQSDVYALALTIVEAVTGRLPFVGENATATLTARVGRLLPVSADLGALAAVLERAARPVAADRYTAVGFGKALMHTASRLPRPAPIPTLAGGLFADRARPGEPEAPTGPTVRPALDDAGSDQTSAEEPMVLPDVLEDDATDTAAAVATDHTAEPAGAESAVALPPAAAEAVDGTPAAVAVPDATPTEEAPGAGPVPLPVGSPIPLPPPTAAAPLAPDFRPGGADDRTEALPVSSAAPQPAADGKPVADRTPVADRNLAVPPAPAVPAARPSGGPTVPVTRLEPVSPVVAAPTADPTRVLPVQRRDPTTVLPAGPVLYDEDPPRRRRVRWWIVPIVLLLLAGGGVAAWFLSRTPSHVIPDLAGKAEPEARNEALSFNWEVAVSNEPSDIVGTGLIIRTDPPAGEKLAEDKTLTLLVSSGPAPRVIPDMVGKPFAEVKDRLEQAGLVVERDEDAFDESIPKGSVLKFTVPDSPGSAVGSTVNKGTTLVLTVSAGPSPRLVPPLTGLSLDDARAQLEQLGLKMAEMPQEFSNDVPAGQVARQDPAVGQKVDRGSEVSVAISKGPDLVPVPTVSGLNAAGIKSALQNAGFVVGAITGDETQALVQMTSGGAAVAAEQPLLRGSTIDLEFAPTPTTTTTTVPPSVPPPGP